MKRFVSVWLPRWPIERRSGRAAFQDSPGRPPPEQAPFVLAGASDKGLRITATNAAADRLGFHLGMPLTDARAIFPPLAVGAADPDGDAAALQRLALWCQGYSPLTRADAPDGLFLDITGCTHLFGGEAVLLETLGRRLAGFGLTARLAIAPSIGAAWAVARHGADARAIVAAETLRGWLEPLPVAGLRLEEPVVRALSRVGLKRIGDLAGKPRAPLAARFGPGIVRRLDQALGLEDESFGALVPEPFYRAGRHFIEPATELAAIEAAVGRLAGDMAATLNRAGRGARLLSLALFRVDGWAETLQVRTSDLALSRDAGHLAWLFRERLERIEDHAGFGFEAAMLSALEVEPVVARQDMLPDGAGRRGDADGIARLLDRLVNRFGAGNVTRFAPCQSYIPERGALSLPILGHDRGRHDWAAHARLLQGAGFGRPLLLFATPEPVRTLAELPDGPPVRFEWRRVSHRVTRAEGPERIAPEWWLTGDGKTHRTRDYYRIEDEAGRRFWLYRDGLYGRQGEMPRWFIHGLFA